MSRVLTPWSILACVVPFASCHLDSPPNATGMPHCLELSQSVHGGEVEVARVGRASLTDEVLLRRLRDQGRFDIGRYGDPRELREFVEDQIRFELLAYAAIERDLHRDPDVIAAARKMMVRRLLEHDLDRDALGETIDDRTLRRSYERNRERYRQPAMHRIAHIQFEATDAGAALAAKLLSRLLDAENEDGYFRQLVRRHSLDEATRARGGELLFKTRVQLEDDFGRSFAGEVFDARDHGIVPKVVQSKRGWHIVRSLAHRDELIRSFEDVRDEIEVQILSRHRRTYFDRYLKDLEGRHPVILHEHRLPGLASRLRAELSHSP